MAVLKKMPPETIIKGLAGIIDFYYDKGQVVARRWPQKRIPDDSPPLTCNRDRFRTFQKCLKPTSIPMRRNYQFATQRSGWRWNDYAYKCYMGRVPYAPLYRPPEDKQVPKPCPDIVGRFFYLHHAYLGIRRYPDAKRDDPHWPSRKRYDWHLEFWVDQPGLWMAMHFDYSPPAIAPHYRTQRGVQKMCGHEPTHFTHPLMTYLNWPMYNDTPHVTHNYSLSPFSWPNVYDTFYFYIAMLEEPNPWWEPRNAFSVSPIFRYEYSSPPNIPVWGYAFRHLDPLFPINWGRRVPWGWMDWNAVFRCPYWPSFTWTPPPYFRYRQEPWYW